MNKIKSWNEFVETIGSWMGRTLEVTSKLNRIEVPMKDDGAWQDNEDTDTAIINWLFD